MIQNDRRQMARFDMEIPVSIRAVQTPESRAHEGLASNVSASGLYLATDLQLDVGAPVEITMKMPALVTGKTSRDWRCVGRVVRVGSDEVPEEKACVGVQFHYYEVIDGQEARHQS